MERSDMFLIRHAEAELNLDDSSSCDDDSPLTVAGHSQIISKFNSYKKYIGCKVESCYVSPMLRCIETAEYFKSDYSFDVCEELRESSKSKWLLERSNNQSFLDFYWHEYMTRLSHLNLKEDSLLITHGGVINFIIFMHLGVQKYPGYDFNVDNFQMVEIKNNLVKFHG